MRATPDRTNTLTTQVRLASGLNVLAGFWLVISPWVLGYAAFGIAVTNAVVFGLAVVILAVMRLTRAYHIPWLSWFNVVIGGWLVAAAFVLGTAGGAVVGAASTETVLRNFVFVGIVVAALGTWSAIATRQARRAEPSRSR